MQLVVSPVGPGEVTELDFLAVMCGCLLVKARGRSFAALPDLFQHEETGAAVHPDWSNLRATITALLQVTVTTESIEVGFIVRETKIFISIIIMVIIIVIFAFSQMTTFPLHIMSAQASGQFGPVPSSIKVQGMAQGACCPCSRSGLCGAFRVERQGSGVFRVSVSG